MLNVLTLSVVRLSVIMLNVIALSVVMLSVVMLIVIMLSVVTLSVIMLSVVMLNVVTLKVAAPLDSVRLNWAGVEPGRGVEEGVSIGGAGHPVKLVFNVIKPVFVWRNKLERLLFESD
jgi:hypothetical protein